MVVGYDESGFIYHIVVSDEEAGCPERYKISTMKISVKIQTGLGLLVALLATAAFAQVELSSPVIVTQDSGRQFSADGVIESARAAKVSSQVAGRVAVLAVDAGDAVDAGQPLVKLDGASVESNLQAARQRLEAALALLQVTEKDYQQYSSLGDKQFVSRADLSRVEGRYKSALAEKRALEADVEASKEIWPCPG